MNENKILPDDPRLTAYALNEMAAAECAEFEQLLAADPAARQAVEEIRAAGAMLASALEAEPAFAGPTAGRPAPADMQSAAILPGGDLRKLDGGNHHLRETLKRTVRFPQLYYMVSGLAAACFAVFFVYWQQNQPVAEAPRRYVEVDTANFKQAEEQASEARIDGAVSRALPATDRLPAVTFGREVAPDEAPGLVLLPSFKDEGKAVSVENHLSVAVENQLSMATARVGKPADSMTFGNANQAWAQPAAPGAEGNAKVASMGDTVVLSVFQTKTESDGYSGASRFSGARSASGPVAMRVSARYESSVQKMHYAPPPEFNTEAYGQRKDNGYLRVADHPLSTFSVDVDTAAYANVRRFLTQGQRPPVDAVRVEELINYFSYNYAQPVGNVPFAASLEVAAAPWAPEHRLVRIGLKGREVSDLTRPAANLVFLLDVSGSMQHPNKLPLVKQSLRLLVNKLRADDRVAIAVYAGSSGLALASTPASRKAEIMEAIERLEAGGSTNGGMGIHLAYDIAKANFIGGGVNRVILATDGDFNVGTTSEGDLVRLVEEKAKSGVFLSVLGFGMGNLKDGTLEQIADKGNGNYAYIDSLTEAKKALVEQAGGTLVTIAKDVKIQVEFNPAQVAAYRLIGYENRLLAKEDFNNDAVDAGEIGAGHTVTALYEVVPAGAELPGEAPAVDELKYQRTEDRGRRTVGSGELLTVKVRYKEPAGEVSSKLEFPLRDAGARFEDASQDFKFAAAVAAFGMVLRDSPHKGALTLAEVSAWGRAGTGNDVGGYRSEFLGLVEKAQAVMQ